MNLLDQLFAYTPVNEQEAADKEEMIRWLGRGVICSPGTTVQPISQPPPGW